jgi:knotted carbamoyltransferase YgeW
MKHPAAPQPSEFPHLAYATLQGLRGESLLSTQDWSVGELDALLDVAKVFERLDRAGIRSELLPDELAWALFFDNSTRTKSAWAGAAARLGMQPVIVDGSSTQLSHGETAAETGAMLGMNAHAMGVRHDLILGEGQRLMRDMKAGIDGYLVATGERRKVPIVNLQCDLDHPTQTLADLQWIRERLGPDLRGRKITVSWAYSPSYAKPLSVPQGLVMLLTRLGANVTLAHPTGYELLPEVLSAATENAITSQGTFRVTNDMDDAFEGADVVYPKSWGPLALMQARVGVARHAHGMHALEEQALAMNASHKDWICDENRMALTHGGSALYMHCLPADIGSEVSAGVMEKARLDVAREAQKKVYVIMALLAVAKVDNLGQRLTALAATAGGQ